LLRLTRGIRDSDVVQIHEFVYPSSVVAMALAWWHHVPVVMVQHTGAVRPTGRVPRWTYALLQAFFARSMFRCAAAIIFVSATSRLYWETRFGTLARARTIWNGVETAAPRSAAPRATRPTVLFVGRLVRKKGVAIVRNVAAALPGIRFVIAGRGIEDPRSWNLPNVDAVGHVDAIRLGVLYREADVLLLPSYSEGYPLVVQEALLEGLAVLTTDEVAAACPPASDLLRHCPVPTTDDPEPWRRALVDAMADEAWLRAREQRSVRARALWSWRGCATAHADTLAGAMSRDA
jgi:glycosyltransferase involved in cell wall biosynthesis